MSPPYKSEHLPTPMLLADKMHVDIIILAGTVCKAMSSVHYYTEALYSL